MVYVMQTENTVLGLLPPDTALPAPPPFANVSVDPQLPRATNSVANGGLCGPVEFSPYSFYSIDVGFPHFLWGGGR